MKIFDILIVVPVLIKVATMPLIYGPLLGNDPRNPITLYGILMLPGAAATLDVAWERV